MQLPGRNHRDLQETVTQWWLSDLSHINLPSPTRAELSSAVFTLPLSLSSALTAISSAIWSIASQMKNGLRVTNLFTSSQKDVCVPTTEAGCLSARLGAASRPGCCLPRQSWEHPGQIILYILQSPFGRLPAALKPLQCSNDAGKNTEDPLLLKHHRDKVSNILLVGLTFLYEVLMKPGKCCALHT